MPALVVPDIHLPAISIIPLDSEGVDRGMLAFASGQALGAGGWGAGRLTHPSQSSPPRSDMLDRAVWPLSDSVPLLDS